jgi:hypothetical protein
MKLFMKHKVVGCIVFRKECSEARGQQHLEVPVMESLEPGSYYKRGFLATKLFGLFGCVGDTSDLYFSALVVCTRTS